MDDVRTPTARQGLFRSALHPEWTVLWQTGRLDVAPNDDIDGIIEKIGRYLRRRRNPVLDRKDFFDRNQEEGENIDQYLPMCISDPSQCDQFADNTALTTVSETSAACEQQLQESVDSTSRWLSNWKLTVKQEQTVTIEFTRRPLPTDFSIHLNDSPLRKVEDQRHLGLVLSADLRWTLHVNRALSKGAHYYTQCVVFVALSLNRH